jgi:hypothetical protein
MENRANAPMLTPLPTVGPKLTRFRPVPLLHSLRRFFLVVVVCLPLALAGCGGSAQPPRSVLLDALALQIQLTQGSIAQALELETPGLPQVSRVRVEEQQALPIGEDRGLRLAGRFEWRLADDPIRVDSPFELYLAKGARGQSWRLARPSNESVRTPGAESSEQRWTTYPLPLPGQRGLG